MQPNTGEQSERKIAADPGFDSISSATLARHVTTLEASTQARYAAGEGSKIRRYKEFFDAAGTWDRVERIVARVEAGPLGVDTRYIVTNLTGGTG